MGLAVSVQSLPELKPLHRSWSANAKSQRPFGCPYRCTSLYLHTRGEGQRGHAHIRAETGTCMQSWLFNAGGLSFGDDHGGRLLEEFRLQVGMADAGENDWARYSYDTKGRRPINRYSCARSTRGDFGSEEN